MCDIGYKTDNIRKPTFNLLSEHQCRSKSKLRISKIFVEIFLLEICV